MTLNTWLNRLRLTVSSPKRFSSVYENKMLYLSVRNTEYFSIKGQEVWGAYEFCMT